MEEILKHKATGTDFFKQGKYEEAVGAYSEGLKLCGGDFVEDMIPTVGFNMRKVTKNKVSIKMWDMGGQERFRNMWERYCRGVTAVVYVLDAADKENFNLAKTELHALMQKPAVAGVPLLVLGNKSDLENAADARTVIDAMELRRLSGREVCCYCIPKVLELTALCGYAVANV